MTTKPREGMREPQAGILPLPGYAGWFRRRGRPWEVLVEADTYELAWERLHAAVMSYHAVDLLVLPTGQLPADAAKPNRGPTPEQWERFRAQGRSFGTKRSRA